MDKIKVSIIIPIYNMDKCLLRCLSSVMNQTLKEIEIICINDGSTDMSLSILKDCADRDNRIKIIDKHNTGYGDSMNIGIEKARGDYIGIVESDDFVHPNMYEKLYNAGVEQSAEIVKANYYNYTTIPEEEIKLFEALKGFEYNKIIEPIDNYRLFLSSPSIWSAIYDRQFLNKYTIRFLATKGASYQDTSFYFKTCFCAKRMFLLKDAFNYYWIDNENSSVNNPLKIFCICDELDEVFSFLLDYDKRTQWEIAFRFKFHTYMWNYYRLSIPYQYTFLIRMVREFQTDMNKGLYNKGFWTDDEQELLNLIISDHDMYYDRSSKYNTRSKVGLEVSMNLQLSDIYIDEMVACFEDIIIYGAGKIGRKIARHLLHTLNIDKKRIKFAVSKDKGQSDEIEEIAIHRIDALTKYKTKSIVIVAVREALQLELLRNINRLGFKNYLVLQQDMLQKINN